MVPFVFRCRRYLGCMNGPRLFDVLPELVRDGVLSADQAEHISARYAEQPEQTSSRLLLLFSILGGSLIGLGIILVVAHNWDSLPRSARTLLAFLPLVIGQCLVVYTISKRQSDRPWKEGASSFLLLAVGACLALVSQIYHIPGELDGFLLTWSLLVVGLIYIPGSLVACLLYIAMITWYAMLVRSGHWPKQEEHPWLVLPLLGATLPFFVMEWRARGRAVGFYWLGLFMAIAIAIMSQLFWTSTPFEIVLAIAGLAAAYTLLPVLHHGQDLRTGAFPLLGGAAMLGILIFLSYQGSWSDLHRDRDLPLQDLVIILSLLGIGILAYAFSLRIRKPFTGTWFPESLGVVLIAYGVGHFAPSLSTLLINGWILSLGVYQIRSGLERSALGQMNLGLGLIIVIIGLRFFDLEINDAVKGVVFIALGIGALLLNMRLIRQRRTTEHA